MAAVFWALLPLAAAKQILVTGGLMRSHHLAVVPVVEGLLARGHNVTFVLPNSSEARGWFPKGLGKAKLVHLGPEDASFASFHMPDMKNLPVHRRILAWADIFWNYQRLIEKPIFGMVKDFSAFLQQHSFDAVFSSALSIGCNQVLLLKNQTVPWVSFMSAPLYPEFVLKDTNYLCNYPNLLNPRSLKELKASLLQRVQNRIECRLLNAYITFAGLTFNRVLRANGFPPFRHFSELLMAGPVTVALGGPPVSPALQLPPKVHVVGIVELPKPRTLPADMRRWLDEAGAQGRPVMYVSMGTKYELTEEVFQKLLAQLERLAKEKDLAVLWSLRESQQKELTLPPQNAHLRFEAFTPQPEVLAHGAVKIFLSHCGWGGLTDSLSAGVPILAYPAFAEQKGNARQLEDFRAARLLEVGFENLPEAASSLLEEPSYSRRAKEAGELLRSFGGLERTLDLVEAAVEKRFLDPLPAQQAMDQVDPFLLKMHEVDIVLSTAFACFCFLVVLCIFTCCCRACCWCCCRWSGSKPKKERKQQKDMAKKEL
ncbi:unnamed protein product [Effrenium voratum]|nr:unnamed protein product [Effrenium voratum]